MMLHLAAAACAAASILTPREHQVLAELLTGSPNKVIADNLGISQRTVEVHRSRIFQKLGVRNAVELAGTFYHRAVASGRLLHEPAAPDDHDA